MRVASDTGPLHALALIEAIEILPALFGGLVIPETVVEELSHPEAPVAVRDWIAKPPIWLSVASVATSVDRSLDRLDLGERQTIVLGRSTGADLPLMDDRAGRSVAQAAGLNVVGTLGLLDVTGRRGRLDLTLSVDRLHRTDLPCRPALFEQLLA